MKDKILNIISLVITLCGGISFGIEYILGQFDFIPAHIDESLLLASGIITTIGAALVPFKKWIDHLFTKHF